MSLPPDVPKDWSFVAWGETSEVHVHNADGSQSDHWARSDKMKRSFGPKKRPAAFEKNGKTKIAMPNRTKPQLTEKPVDSSKILDPPP